MAKKYLSLEGLVEYDSLLKTNLDITLGNYQDALNQISSGTTVVGKAQEATHAESATTANSATEATHAVSADTATRAVNADNATKATQDSNGKVISETYETKADASAKLVEAKEYTDEKIAAIPSSAGKDVSGQEFIINGGMVIADKGAEIFNDYENNIAITWYSHAEGSQTTAKGYGAHAEGTFTTAAGDYSHAEGTATVALGRGAHAEGCNSYASGEYSHAEGSYTIPRGHNSHAEGCGTTASGENSHVQGKYNIEDTNNAYQHIVGNGVDANNRSNVHTLDWFGNAWFAGDVYVGSTSGTNKDDGSKKLATVADIESAIGTAIAASY